VTSKNVAKNCLTSPTCRGRHAKNGQQRSLLAALLFTEFVDLRLRRLLLA
jgi:hypothetical protein